MRINDDEELSRVESPPETERSTFVSNAFDDRDSAAQMMLLANNNNNNAPTINSAT